MISIIVAINKNNGIGYKNELLYWLPNDLKRLSWDARLSSLFQRVLCLTEEILF